MSENVNHINGRQNQKLTLTLKFIQQLKGTGVSCKSPVNDCDIEDTCDGKSNLCVDVVKPNGHMCHVSV